jgi:hypothetical protein
MTDTSRYSSRWTDDDGCLTGSAAHRGGCRRSRSKTPQHVWAPTFLKRPHGQLAGRRRKLADE